MGKEAGLQSSGAVLKSRWPSWAPIPNKPTVSVNVKQHFNHQVGLTYLELSAEPSVELPMSGACCQLPVVEGKRVTTPTPFAELECPVQLPQPYSAQP